MKISFGVEEFIDVKVTAFTTDGDTLHGHFGFIQNIPETEGDWEIQMEGLKTNGVQAAADLLFDPNGLSSVQLDITWLGLLENRQKTLYLIGDDITDRAWWL